MQAQRHRTGDGLGVALWVPPFTATTANLKGLLQRALLGRSKPRLATSSRELNITASPAPLLSDAHRR